MRFFIIFIVALFTISAAHADTECTDGRYLDGDVCTACPTGTYNDNPFATECTPCPAGTYGKTSGLSYKKKSFCEPCAAGTYSDTVGATACTTCPDNTYSMTGATRCDETCPAGTYADTSSNTCVTCPDTFPNSDPGATDISGCYSDTKYRKCDTGTPDGCAAMFDTSCEYVAYCGRKGPKGYEDGVIKSGCESTSCSDTSVLSVSASPGYFVKGLTCEACPDGMVSFGGDVSECTICPENTYYTDSATCTACPARAPNSDPGAANIKECYSDIKQRDCSASCVKPNLCATVSCNFTTCEYIAYFNNNIKPDGVIKWGCASCDEVAPISVTALPGAIVNGLSCEICQPGTYSAGGNATTCNACPNGATTFAGATSRDECMRILNYLPTGQTTPTKIYMGMKQNTHPAFAAKIGDDIFYANMTPVDAHDTPGLYVRYNGDNYRVQSGIKSDFFVTTTSDTSSFSFYMSAAGNFTVDWGDGVVENIIRDTTRTTYSHTYDVAGEYTIGFGGRAIGYGGGCGTKLRPLSAIRLSSVNIASVSGTLADMFPTIGGVNPSFEYAFSGATNLTGQIPPGLFADFTGTPQSCMFQNTFQNTPNLTGPTARTANGTRVYDIEYNGEKWIDAYPSAFTDMYTGSGIDTNN